MNVTNFSVTSHARQYSAKENFILIDPTDRSHLIYICFAHIWLCTYLVRKNKNINIYVHKHMRALDQFSPAHSHARTRSYTHALFYTMLSTPALHTLDDGDTSPEHSHAQLLSHTHTLMLSTPALHTLDDGDTSLAHSHANTQSGTLICTHPVENTHSMRTLDLGDTNFAHSTHAQTPFRNTISHTHTLLRIHTGGATSTGRR